MVTSLTSFVAMEIKKLLKAPKSGLPAAKLATIRSWFIKSCSAHSIKDLEKALPSVASINSMQVKDYLQALSDENQIHVEKIGSGNWYWAFSNEELQLKRNELHTAQENRDKLQEEINELEKKLHANQKHLDSGPTENLDNQSQFEGLLTEQDKAFKDLDGLYAELLRFGSKGRFKTEENRQLAKKLEKDTHLWTEQIQIIEGWFREQLSGDLTQLDYIKRSCYGIDYEEEENGLREL